MKIIMKVRTVLALGLFNLIRVFKYRMGVRIGLNSVQKITAVFPSGSFFSRQFDINQNVELILNELNGFGYLRYSITGNYPNWFYSPLTKKEFRDVNQPWYLISDFNSEVGDIKGVWEASRFNWVLDLILLERQRQDGVALNQLDLWLNHWCASNPPYEGPNWKCGQEASIRVMHVVAALVGLDQLHEYHENLLKFIEVHLKRIAPTIEYAIAQDNNHGTSEATALFIGGALLYYFMPEPKYKAWTNLGRKWLENRAKKLIMPDGGFSQYSSTYHRVMLDSYSLAEIIRHKFGSERFSDELYSRLKKATDWLYILTESNSGDVPNIGANDGAHLLHVSSTDYRDFRPSVQLASTLFSRQSYYTTSGSYDESLIFFHLDKEELNHKTLPKKDQFFYESGLITAEERNFFIVFKLPVFKFRPSQCDALHLDVWWKEQNILRDGGTYSYNSTTEDLDYFSGVESHNTVQFDEHQQMPRLSRFLLGAWLKPIKLSYQPDHFICAYQDYWGCEHQREITLTENQVQVVDTVSGFNNQATVRWRLQPGKWSLCDNVLSNDNIRIVIDSESELTLRLVQGEESRYYYQKQPIPVLEIKVLQAASITTIIQDLT